MADEAGSEHPDGEWRVLAEGLIVRLTTRSFLSRGGTGCANEEAGRTARSGELRQLEDAWREAEEVAATADHLREAEVRIRRQRVAGGE